MPEFTREERAQNPASLRRVMACLDGSELGERSIPHAIAIANALGVPVTLLRVLERAAADKAPADPIQWELQRREARDYMDRLAANFSAADARIDSELIDGSAAEEICRWSEDRDVDLTVATTHGGGGVSPWALASTVRKLLDRAPGSLLVVPSRGAASTEGVARYRRLLLPLDGSSQAETALPIVKRIALAQSAELVIAHVVPTPQLTQIGPLNAEDIELTERLRRRNERVARTYLDRLRDRLEDDGVDVRVLLLYGGDVAARIASLAQTEQVDLLVLAAHGQNARANLPCGSVTSELLARSSVPLLVVRARAAKTLRRGATQMPVAKRLPQPIAS